MESVERKDPAAAEKIHWNNQRKVIRALEVLETTGHSITAPKEEPKQLYDYLMIGLDTKRSILYERINQRVDLMLAEGLVAEARKVYELGEVQASQGIGYKEFFLILKERNIGRSNRTSQTTFEKIRETSVDVVS